MANLGYLYELRRVLDNVQPHQFNWDDWWDQRECGTVGCVAGWAAASSTLLNEAGLEFSGAGLGTIVTVRGVPFGPVRFANLFDIEHDEAEALFYAEKDDIDDKELKDILSGIELEGKEGLETAKRVLDIIISRYE